MSCIVCPFCNMLCRLPEPGGGMSIGKERNAAQQMMCSSIWLVLFFRSDVPIPSSVPVINTCFHLSQKQCASKKEGRYCAASTLLVSLRPKKFDLIQPCPWAAGLHVPLASLLFITRWEEKSGEKGKSCGKQKSSSIVRGCCLMLLRLIFYYLLGKAGSSGFKNKCVNACKQ